MVVSVVQNHVIYAGYNETQSSKYAFIMFSTAGPRAIVKIAVIKAVACFSLQVLCVTVNFGLH